MKKTKDKPAPVVKTDKLPTIEPRLDPYREFIRLDITKKLWQESYTLRARFYIKLVAFLFPGFFRIYFEKKKK